MCNETEPILEKNRSPKSGRDTAIVQQVPMRCASSRLPINRHHSQRAMRKPVLGELRVNGGMG